MKIYTLSLVSALLVLLCGYLVPWTITPLIIGLTYAIAALGISVMLRAGQVSFGHAMYASVAAYSIAFITRLRPETDVIVLIMCSVAIATLFSALIGMFVVRYRGIFFGMLNLALSMVLFALTTKFYDINGGTDGIRVSRPTVAGIVLERGAFEFTLMCIALAGSLLIAWAVQRYFRSGNGQALAAIKTNETRLEYLGISPRHVLWKGYILSGAVVGFSGAILALIQGLVTPEIGTWLRSAEYVYITILGGAAHVSGAFIGAAIFETVKLISSAYFPGFWQAILGLTLILVIFVVPNGVVGQIMRKHKLKRA